MTPTNLKYRRIVRALKFNEWAYAIYFAELSHPIMHAALESMICTTSNHNKAQVIQRLPQLVSFINQKEAEDNLPHLLRLQTRSASDAYANTESHRRVSSDRSTQSGLRHALEGSYKELTDKSVTKPIIRDILADPKLMRQHFPAYKGTKLI